jgi:hypothetical protein
MTEEEVRLECLKLAVTTAGRRAVTENQKILDISVTFYEHVSQKGDSGKKRPGRPKMKK